MIRKSLKFAWLSREPSDLLGAPCCGDISCLYRAIARGKHFETVIDVNDWCDDRWPAVVKETWKYCSGTLLCWEFVYSCKGPGQPPFSTVNLTFWLKYFSLDHISYLPGPYFPFHCFCHLRVNFSWPGFKWHVPSMSPANCSSFGKP